jgi:hypothetical protein
MILMGCCAMMNKQSRELQLMRRSLFDGGVENSVKLRGNREWANAWKGICLRYDRPARLVGAIAQGT